MENQGTRPRYTVNAVYPEALEGLCSLLHWALEGRVDSGCWYGTFYRWFQKDLEHWYVRRQTLHHLQAYGGMGSFNDAFPDERFPGGEEGFGRFYEVYRHLKEISYWCAMLWHQYRSAFPDRPEDPLRLLHNGVPVSICTCSEGHTGMREDFSDSFYRSSASHISVMEQVFTLVGSIGGVRAVPLLMDKVIVPEPDPILLKMREAFARSGYKPHPGNCRACKRKKIPCMIMYLTGDPTQLTKEHFSIGDCILSS